MSLPYPCSSQKTAQIVLAPPAITPANGYKVKWRVAGTTSWNTYPNQFGTTINIVGVPACYNLEVSIQADCDGGGSGPETIVLVAGSVTCYTYTFNSGGQFQYTPCNSTVPLTVDAVQGTSVCAINDTVVALEGGTFSRAGSCIP